MHTKRTYVIKLFSLLLFVLLLIVAGTISANAVTTNGSGSSSSSSSTSSLAPTGSVKVYVKKDNANWNDFGTRVFIRSTTNTSKYYELKKYSSTTNYAVSKSTITPGTYDIIVTYDGKASAFDDDIGYYDYSKTSGIKITVTTSGGTATLNYYTVRTTSTKAVGHGIISSNEKLSFQTSATSSINVILKGTKISNLYVNSLPGGYKLTKTTYSKAASELGTPTYTSTATNWEYSFPAIATPVTIVFHIDPITYTATFNANSGTWADSTTANKTKSYNINGTLTAPATISRAGYTFIGWKVTSTGGNWTTTTYNNSTQTTLSGASGKYGTVTFTAQWRKNVVTVNVNKDGAVLNTKVVVKIKNTSTSTMYALSQTDGTNTYKTSTAIPNGTYKIFATKSSVNSALTDTGKSITVSNSSPTTTVNYYSITLIKGEGIASVSGAVSYLLSGQSQNIAATLAANYSFNGWTGTVSASSATHTINNISKKYVMTATGLPYSSVHFTLKYDNSIWTSAPSTFYVKYPSGSTVKFTEGSFYKANPANGIYEVYAKKHSMASVTKIASLTVNNNRVGKTIDFYSIKLTHDYGIVSTTPAYEWILKGESVTLDAELLNAENRFSFNSWVNVDSNFSTVGTSKQLVISGVSAPIHYAAKTNDKYSRNKSAYLTSPFAKYPWACVTGHFNEASAAGSGLHGAVDMTAADNFESFRSRYNLYTLTKKEQYKGETFGKEVVAAADGVVVESGWNAYGNYVLIKHEIPDGYADINGLRTVYTLYGHLMKESSTTYSDNNANNESEKIVHAGDKVVRGQVIGHAGCTYDPSLGGRSYGSHLHFELRTKYAKTKYESGLVDPEKYVSFTMNRLWGYY